MKFIQPVTKVNNLSATAFVSSHVVPLMGQRYLFKRNLFSIARPNTTGTCLSLTEALAQGYTIVEVPIHCMGPLI